MTQLENGHCPAEGGKAATTTRVTRRRLRWAAGVLASLLLAAVLGMRRTNPDSAASLTQVDQALWDEILRQYVDDEGKVAYEQLAEHGRQKLDRYMAQLAQANPAAMTRPGRLALWINAYNAGIVAAVLKGFSPETLLSRARLFRWYTFPVAGRLRTPDEIENKILRRQFHEPRIHFALVCGATSCPKLRREAYRGNRIDQQLDEQARRFINDPSRNRIDPTSGQVALSSIFDWFAPDFAAAAGSVGNFVARYVHTPQQAALLRRRDIQFKYLRYDWALNVQRGQRVS
ncbi:MAG: DUF547 domain-containing protein [Candidatus Binatia bacterium]